MTISILFVTPPLPQPATWILFSIGFAALGFASFRQRLATVSAWRE
jgi:hypothetical protein